MNPFDLASIQKALLAAGLDGWLLYDFQAQNPIARRLVRFPQHRFATRRWFYFIPSRGEPVGVVHAIESHHLDHLPGRKLPYAGWQEMRERLSEATSGATRIAMEYSPDCNIPYVSRVDAGTIEILRGLGKTIASSADLVSFFDSRLNEDQMRLHRQAASATIEAKDRAFAEIRRRLLAGEPVSEVRVQEFILGEFVRLGLITSSPPIVAVNQHSGDPHYAPSGATDLEIHPGDLVLIDLWARIDSPEGVYADFTWVGYAGSAVPERVREIWELVREARDRAISFVMEQFSRGAEIRGCDVDDVARKFIEEKGYGQAFFHRTGHNIGLEVHGNGTHLDNFETRDERQILPRTAFSIEPGIYLADFGIRSEVNLLTAEGRAEVTGEPIQTEVLRLLAEG